MGWAERKKKSRSCDLLSTRPARLIKLDREYIRNLDMRFFFFSFSVFVVEGSFCPYSLPFSKFNYVAQALDIFFFLSFDVGVGQQEM